MLRPVTRGPPGPTVCAAPPPSLRSSTLTRPRRPLVRLAVATALLGAAGALLLRPPPLSAQLAPLAFEARGGVALPVAGFRDGSAVVGEVEGAPTFGFGLVTRSRPGWGVAVGFAQNRFTCVEGGCPGAGELVATDLEVGAVRTFGQGRVVPWLRAGFTAGRTEVEAGAVGSDEPRLSDLALGATAGAGLAVRIGGRWGLSPGLRYGWTNTRVPREGLLRMRYLMADVGVLLLF